MQSVTIGEVFCGWVVLAVLGEVGAQDAVVECERCRSRQLYSAFTLVKRRCKPCGRCDPARVAEFWAKVDKAGPLMPRMKSVCWRWLGTHTRDGYGIVSINDVASGSHRIAWEITNGRSAGDLDVMHQCNNPGCCNPDHLSIGTHEENIRYRVECGRTASGAQHGRNTEPGAFARLKGEGHWRRDPAKAAAGASGERHGMAKLTREQALEVRRLYAENADTTQAMIAEKLGLTQAHVSDIVTGKAWAELNDGGITPRELRILKVKERDAAILADVAAGVSQAEACRRHGVTAGVMIRLLGKGKWAKSK